MIIKCMLVAILLILSQLVCSQEDTAHKSIHQIESKLYSSRGDSILKLQERFRDVPSPLVLTKKLDLSRKVFGWHPYWASATAYLAYDYTVLTHLAYFSYETDTITGGYKTIRGWDQTPVIEFAHQKGVKVILTVTNFGANANRAILRDTLKQINMIQTITSLLKSRNGDGVNFDFETVSLPYRANLVAFMQRAAKSIKAELPSAEISMATPAVDWNGSWDLSALATICDYLIVMGYDYYWSSSPTAGPVAPLIGENYNVTRSVDTYLSVGVPAQKLLLGMPWFGYNWPVNSTNRKAAAIGSATAVTWSVAENMSSGYNKTFDQITKVPWLSFKDVSNVYHQLWYDDQVSYNFKYDLVKSRNLAGIGIWALSYENGKNEIWQGIQSAFSTTGIAEVVDNELNHPEWSVIPNPIMDKASVQFSLTEWQHVELKVFDLTGKPIVIILHKELPAGSYKIQMNCSQLNDGLYLLVFITKSGNHTRKIVVKKN